MFFSQSRSRSRNFIKTGAGAEPNILGSAPLRINYFSNLLRKREKDNRTHRRVASPSMDALRYRFELEFFRIYFLLVSRL
jgi:hypothetical protein